jgi:hypothetical protein
MNVQHTRVRIPRVFCRGSVGRHVSFSSPRCPAKCCDCRQGLPAFSGFYVASVVPLDDFTASISADGVASASASSAGARAFTIQTAPGTERVGSFFLSPSLLCCAISVSLAPHRSLSAARH